MDDAPVLKDQTAPAWPPWIPSALRFQKPLQPPCCLPAFLRPPLMDSRLRQGGYGGGGVASEVLRGSHSDSCSGSGSGTCVSVTIRWRYYAVVIAIEVLSWRNNRLGFGSFGEVKGMVVGLMRSHFLIGHLYLSGIRLR